MSSRMNKYYEEPENLMTRTTRNQDLYKDISKSELENYSIKSNATILGDNKNEIDVEKIKKILDTKYNEVPKRKTIKIEEEEEEIIEKPYMLNVDYLIFGYDMSDDGIVTIKDLWLKKVWEITRRMDGWSINLQVKQGVVHKIRPGVWYSDRPGNIPMFKSMEDFIAAIEEAVYQNPKTHESAATWKKNFIESYRKFYGVKLDIPRWQEIASKYEV